MMGFAEIHGLKMQDNIMREQPRIGLFGTVRVVEIRGAVKQVHSVVGDGDSFGFLFGRREEVVNEGELVSW